MLEVLESVLPHDDFTRRLVEIYRAIDGEGRDVQKVHLGINRSDYMLHGQTMESSRILQVEINTIASSFGCLSVEISRLHRYLLEKVLGRTKAAIPRSPFSSSSSSTAAGCIAGLPYNDAIRGLAHGLALAHHEYLRQEQEQAYVSTTPFPRPCVLMIVQPGERNIMDQKLLELALWEEYGVPLHRATLSEVAIGGHLDLQRRQNLLLKAPISSFPPRTAASTTASSSPSSSSSEKGGLVSSLIAATTGTVKERAPVWTTPAGEQEEIEITVAYFRAGYVRLPHTCISSVTRGCMKDSLPIVL